MHSLNQLCKFISFNYSLDLTALYANKNTTTDTMSPNTSTTTTSNKPI